MEHIIIAPNSDNPQTERREMQGRVERYFLPARVIRFAGQKFFLFRKFSTIARVLNAHRPQIVEIADKVTAYFYGKKLLQLKRDFPFKIVVFNHERSDLYLESVLGKFASKKMHRWVLTPYCRIADGIICNSHFSAQEFVEFTTKAPLFILPLGIRSDWFSKEMFYDRKLRGHLSDNGKKLVVVHIGRLTPEKRVLLLRDIVLLLDPQRFVCVIVGDGPQAGFLRKCESVFFAGYGDADRVRRYLAASDVGVLVNDRESFGLVALEMMAAGLPILGPQKGGLSEILRDSFAYRLPADPQAYFRALLTLQDAELRQKMGRRARNFFLKKFTSDTMIASLLSFYQKIYE